MTIFGVECTRICVFLAWPPRGCTSLQGLNHCLNRADVHILRHNTVRQLLGIFAADKRPRMAGGKFAFGNQRSHRIR